MATFIELHLMDGSNETIMINIDRVKSIYSYKGITRVYVGEVEYKVKESYDDIRRNIIGGVRR
jgi:hypothetical protein